MFIYTSHCPRPGGRAARFAPHIKGPTKNQEQVPRTTKNPEQVSHRQRQPNTPPRTQSKYTPDQEPQPRTQSKYHHNKDSKNPQQVHSGPRATKNHNRRPHQEPRATSKDNQGQAPPRTPTKDEKDALWASFSSKPCFIIFIYLQKFIPCVK